MVSIKEFSTLLQTTVTADRLSGSKIQALREQALSLADKGEDVELITKFFKLNSSLPAASTSRISSLYVFDAIARDAKTASLGKDVGKGKGKATAMAPAAAGGLLMKMEGVVESWVTGMVEDGKGGVWTEGREKIQKILDIWTKSSTFPQTTLDRLQSKVKNTNPAVSTSSLTPQIIDPPPPVMSPALPPLDDGRESKGASRNGNEAPKSTTPPLPPPSSSSAANAGLPSEILKLLGVPPTSSNPDNLAAPKPTAASGGGIDLAAILAGVKASTTTASPTPPAPAVPLAPPAIPNFSFDPNQLKALASIAASVQTPHPPPPQAYTAPGGGFPPPTLPAGGFSGNPPPRGYGDHSRSPQFDDRPPYGRSDPREQFSPPRGGYDRGPSASSGGANWNEQGRGGEYHQRNGSRDEPRRRSRSPPGPPPGDYSRDRWDDRAPRQMDGRQGSRDVGEGRGGGWRDERRDHEFAERGSNDRGRGRGRGRGGWDNRPSERDRPDDNNDWNRRPPPRNDYGERGGPGRVISPSRPNQALPNIFAVGMDSHRGRVALPTAEGKDEFGRDLPTPNPGGGFEAGGEEDMALDDSDGEAEKTKPAAAPNFANQQSQAPPNAFPPFPPPQAAAFGAPPNGAVGLSTFDMSTFNPADPSSWSRLAAAWQVTFGREPNQMELMGFLSGQM